MKLKRKLLVVAMATALPWMSAYAQSPADLQKEIELLKGQLKMLSEKIEAMSAKVEPVEMEQKVTRLEQKIELAEDNAIKSGFKGLNVKGVIEAAYKYDTISKVNGFKAQGGYGDETAMLELTKEAEGGEGINWTLRLLPGSATLVHEATVSFPVAEGTRVYGGVIPDFQGYEGSFANQNPLLTHNALFDLAGPASYTGLGMTHALTKEVALKWMLGNIDGGSDDVALKATEIANGNPLPDSTAGSKRTVGLAYRFDWTISEYATLGLSGAHASSYRKFDVMAVDGGYIRGDWLFNGHVNIGSLANGAYNGGDAKWWGVSALAGFKVTPRLQLLARADYLNNRDNGGGTYVTNYLNNAGASGPLDSFGIGPELNSSGAVIDPNVGANLTRLSLGTNYLVNPSTQWKTEVRVDQSTGSNFLDADGNFKNSKTTIGTSVVVAF